LHLKKIGKQELMWCLLMQILLWRLCPRPTYPYIIGKLRLWAFSRCY
jgi:hypothetical protein